MNRETPISAATAVANVLIVVPTLNEEKHVGRVVRRLLSGVNGHASLVVADGGSTDRTRDIVRRLAERDRRVRLVHNPLGVQSAGVNRAVRELGHQADYLIRADAHADYPHDFCERLLEEIVMTGAEAVTVRMRTLGRRGFRAGVAAAQNSYLGTGGSPHRVGRGGRFVEHGHHAIMRVDAFRAVGGYDESFGHNEDAELDLRLTQAGGRIWLTDRVTVGYVPRRDARSLFRQYFNHGHGRAATLIKHRVPPRPRQVLPLAVPVALAAAFVGAVAAVAGAGPKWLLLFAPALGWAATCLLGGILLAARERSAAVAWAGPAALVMHLAWSLGFFWRLAGGRR